MITLNRALTMILYYLLPALLVLLPVGAIYRIIEAKQLEGTGVSSEWTGVLLIFLVAMEFYLMLHYFWFRLIFRRALKPIVKLINLLTILFLGLLPGLAMLYPTFIKSS